MLAKKWKNIIEPILDERYIIAKDKDSTIANESYYQGMLRAIEYMGHDWRRDANGKHEVF